MNRIKQSQLALALFVVAGAAAASTLSIGTRVAHPTRSMAADYVAESGSFADEPIPPIPRPSQIDSRKVELGKRLFHDRRLSADNTVSCASCHDLRQAGVDHRATSLGIGGAVGEMNAPTVFNSGFSFRQFWDGRAETLEDQIDGPVHSSAEMASNWPAITKKLRADPDCANEFSNVYDRPIDEQGIKEAIATFERSLVTPDCRFDRYLRGERGALTADEKEGYRLFKVNGCSSCHQGVLAGGNMFEKFGVVADYFADRGRISKADLGRFNVTGQETDRYRFKVPSLRNVALTAPYFHDGSAQTLDEAVVVMAKYQLGRQLTKEEILRIVLFLKTLTGESVGEGR